ncbi:MAG: hypothetical protein LUF29_08125 [Oscillospiraceae bacterium]|nr:hypothetical protein [Oscillospiraceae bacterium]
MKHTLKKLLSILLSLTMLLSLAGCQVVEEPVDTDDEVVGGGLIQARDGEVSDEEVMDDDAGYEPTEEPEVEDEAIEDEEVLQIDLEDISSIAPEEGVSFYALVINANGNSLAVCGLNSTVNDVNHDGLFSVGLSSDAEIAGRVTSVDDITAGDIVVITYSGEVMETYPAQISGASRVYVANHISRLSEIEYLLPEGYESFGEYFPAWDDFEF